MPFSKCLRAKIYSNMHVYFDQQGCQTLLLKESDPLLFSLGSWTRKCEPLTFVLDDIDIRFGSNVVVLCCFTSTINIKGHVGTVS